MIQITQLKLPVSHNERMLREKVAKTLGIRPEEIQACEIIRRSVDARKREGLQFVYTVRVQTAREQKILARSRHKNVMSIIPEAYHFPPPGSIPLQQRPVIMGCGPSCLFCAYILALHGYRPLVLEQGDTAAVRKQKVDQFWKTGILDEQSNVQFGEGGAGTFSDGKLNTGVKDKNNRNRQVLEIFVGAGAPREILFDARPHLGTDLLIRIVENLRSQILSMGGSFRFRTQVTDLKVREGKIASVIVNGGEEIPAEAVVLAVGHSARHTFRMLWEKNLSMEAKAFAVGVRIEHPQEMITRTQYGENVPRELRAASYKTAVSLPDGRGVYSFCMCPGGFVVNASSETGCLAVNGMSYHARDGRNANSAIVVTVRPEDYLPYSPSGSSDPLGGIDFQRYLERAAYRAAGGKIPVQRFEDFCLSRPGGPGSFAPCMKGDFAWSNVRAIFPEFLGDSLERGIRAMDRQIRGFSMPDALLSGVESRTSSPVRILRNQGLEGSISGIYPCGEGAGYAGGITSAAMDGLRVAEAIGKKFVNFR